MIVSENKEKVSNSKDIYNIMKEIYKLIPEEDKHKELAYCIGLNTKNIIQYIDLVGIGTIDHTPVYTRECLRLAIIKDCKNIIFIHNHPTGDIKPSPQDEIFTKKLKQGGELLEINLLDHLILGDKYFSFADEGII